MVKAINLKAAVRLNNKKKTNTTTQMRKKLKLSVRANKDRRKSNFNRIYAGSI